MKRTGSIGSRVGPAVTTARRPLSGPSTSIAALPEASAASTTDAISSGSATRPSPTSPQAWAPLPGPMSLKPRPRKVVMLAWVAAFAHIRRFIAGATKIGRSVASTSAAPETETRESLFWISPQGVRFGIGWDEATLSALGIETVTDLATSDTEVLVGEFGPTMGPWFHRLGRGVERRHDAVDVDAADPEAGVARGGHDSHEVAVLGGGHGAVALLPGLAGGDEDDLVEPEPVRDLGRGDEVAVVHGVERAAEDPDGAGSRHDAVLRIVIHRPGRRGTRVTAAPGGCRTARGSVR